MINSASLILNTYTPPKSIEKVIAHNQQKVEATNIQSDKWMSNMRKQGVKAEPYQPYIRFYVKT